MFKTLRRKFQNGSFFSLGLAIGTIALTMLSTPVLAAFSDTKNHWARPFIERLAQREIIAGYPDGTFRPNQAVQRDEFAAILRKAFNQPAQRQIASGNVYKDVPENYWAETAIEEAYEMGFMSGYPGNVFRPNQRVTRADLLASLMGVLDVPTSTAGTPTTQTTTRRATRPRMFLPLAFASLMQPMIVQRQVQRPVAATRATAPSSDVNLSQYYNDANQIPKYAVNAVEQATQGNIIVNHPNVRVLNPNQPATRGDAAAFVHQALVSQGQLEPLPGNVEATNYIVGRSQNQSKQNKQ